MLYHSTIGNPNGALVAVLHGILGSGLNWTGFIKHLLSLRPDLQFVLIDLRNHGRSPHYSDENTLLQTAMEVLELQQELGSFEAIIGHSFGGKVALQIANIPFFNEIEQYWILDSSPGIVDIDPRDPLEVSQVLNVLRSIELPVERRIMVKEQLMQKGLSLMLAQWMTTNLKKEKDGYRWKFNLQGVQEMIQDYFEQDLWTILEDPSLDFDVHFVRATQSDRWDQKSIERLDQTPERSTIHHLDAGHWVHVDNPEGLSQILSQNLLS